MKPSKQLKAKLSTVFTEYAARVYSAAEAAEQRLTELEARDRERDRRDNARREAIRDKYPGIERGA